MKLYASESGSSLLEFSLILPVVLLMFIGIVDFGVAISQAMTVEEAARTGAQWGALAVNGPGVIGAQSAVTGMQNAAKNAAGALSVSPQAKLFCRCDPSDTLVDCSSTGATACGSTYSMVYAQVTTTSTASLLFGYSGLPTSIPLHGFAELRIQ